jgi:thiol-disulfide isomerase/thioredoxin
VSSRLQAASVTAGICLALIAAALGLGAQSLAAGARAQPPARPLRGFVRDVEFILVMDGAQAPLELYKSESAGAIVLLSPRFRSPLVLRAGALATVDAAQLEKRPDATLDLAADAVLTPHGTFQVTRDGVAFAIDGHQASVRHVDASPLLGLRRLDEVTAHNPEYLAAASRYVANPQAVAALRQQRRPITVRVYYGSWCAHCRQLVPHAVRVEQLVRGSQLRFEYFGLRNPLNDPEARKAGVSVIPTAVVSAGGREVGRILSDGDWQALEVALRRLLAAKPGP